MTTVESGLHARLVVERPAFRLDIELSVAPGEVVALLGPNGAGKTTALRALAGLTPLTGGRIELAGTCLDDAAGTFVPAERRGVGVVFQDYLLFPHLSAQENVAFGPRCRGASRAQARATAQAWLSRLGLTDVAGRRPRHLSGGQAQRVALARALAVEPALLLLDEPLAALDARTRLDTRADLHRHLADHPGPTLVVTHDPLDAFVLADRLVIIEDGRIVQEGDAATVTARPRTDYVARLVGLNLYRGHGDGHVVTIPGAAMPTNTASITEGPASPMALTTADTVHGDAFVAFAPAAVALHLEPPQGSPRNVWRASVIGVTRHGDNIRVRLRGGPGEASADVTPAAAAALRLEPGQSVWVAVKASETRAYPAG